MEAQLRIATIADIGDLLAMMREFYAIDAYPFDERIARGALEALLRDPALGRAWVMRAGGGPAGYVILTLGYSLEYHGRDAFVDELYVRPGYRARGLGEQAVGLVEQTCRELGIHALHLEVERTNTAAQRLYQRLGFQDHGRYLLTKWMQQ